MNVKVKEVHINKKIIAVIVAIALVGIGFMGMTNKEEKRIIEYSTKAIEDGDYEYARSALVSVVDDSNNRKIMEYYILLSRS